MRRTGKKIVAAVIGMVILCTGILSGCQAAPKLVRYEAQYLDLFDTVTTIIAYCEKEEEFEEQAEIIYSELKTCHELFDIYKDYDGISNIKTINDNAGIEPVQVDERIIGLLLLAREMYEKTEGKMSVAYGSVLSLWHKYRTEGLDDPGKALLPPKKELLRAAKHTDMDKVILDEKRSTVYLEDKEMSLDVGAIGKGYAAERAAEAARNAGMTSFLISVGGNVVSEGTRADGSLWTIGIQNPDTESREAYVLKVALNGKALVTSGNYQRFYLVDGKRYHHIIDPDTLMPSDYFASVSIIAKDSGTADALSTGIYNMPLEDGERLIETLEDTEAVWIMEDGTQVFSSGFRNYTVE